MNTNNKEVIELLRIAKGEIIEGYTNGPVDLIQKVIDSLQDNEDTEVQEVKLHKSENPLALLACELFENGILTKEQSNE